MKKVVFALAVLFSAALVSCGNKAAEATDSDSVVAVEETAVVADSNDTTVVVAEEVAAAPVAESAK